MAEHGLLRTAPSAAAAATILLVDDELDVLRIGTQLIRRRLPHVRVFEASNGRQALDLMRRVLPDLLLLDLMMPELDGFGVLEAMQAQPSLRTIPVIIMTAQALPEETMLQLNGSVAGVVGKGLFHEDETLQQIEAVLRGDKRVGEWRAANCAPESRLHSRPLCRTDHTGGSGPPCGRKRALLDTLLPPGGRHHADRLSQPLPGGGRQGHAVQGGKSIGEVAAAGGFAGSSQFSRVFHHYTGMSPRAYLRAYLHAGPAA